MEQIARAICEAKGYDPDAPINETQVQWQVFAELAKSTATRPTADLGEDGDLIARLRAVDSSTDELGGDIGTNSYRNPDGPEAADRIEPYREALEGARADIDFACTAIMKGHEHKGRARLEQTLKRVSAVLSRSGG